MIAFHRKKVITRRPDVFRLDQESPQAQGLVSWIPLCAAAGGAAEVHSNRGLLTFTPGAVPPTWVDAGEFGVVPYWGQSTDENFIYSQAPDCGIGGTYQMSLAVWCNWDGSNDNVYARAWVRGSQYPWEVYKNRNSVALNYVLKLRTSSLITTQTTDGTFTANDWVLLVMTYDGVNLTSYFQGLQDGQTAETNPIYNSDTTQDEYIGTYSSGANPWQGWLTEFCLWNRCLPADEVYSLYEPTTRWDKYWSPSTTRYFWVSTPGGALEREAGTATFAWSGLGISKQNLASTGTFAFSGLDTQNEIFVTVGEFATSGLDIDMQFPVGTGQFATEAFTVTQDIPLNTGTFAWEPLDIIRLNQLGTGEFAWEGLNAAGTLAISISTAEFAWSALGVLTNHSIDTSQFAVSGLDQTAQRLLGLGEFLVAGLSLNGSAITIPGEFSVEGLPVTTDIPANTATFAFSGLSQDIQHLIGIGEFAFEGIDIEGTAGVVIGTAEFAWAGLPIVVERLVGTAEFAFEGLDVSIFEVEIPGSIGDLLSTTQALRSIYDPGVGLRMDVNP